MHLKKMELKGFKSFPDKTEILFPKGLISVVGPNGSGKSNILDAVRWVLGEQSMKNLRGEKLEDVIFSGTEKRKEMGYCEVSLIIDNSDQKINLEYTEIAIKRKAFKSGESQFFINNKPCRLKDIKELLLDTGIGREGYSIISQGKIDEIVNGSSVHRRKILEEAAGITKFRYKKEESEKKLSSTKENLERINDIYKEIEKQIKPLELQKEKAEKYFVLREELIKSDINRVLKDFDVLYKSQRDALAEVEILKKKVKETERLKQDITNKIFQSKGELGFSEENIKEYLEEIEELVKLEQSCLRKYDVTKEKIVNIKSNNIRLKDSLSSEKIEIENLNKKIKNIDIELNNIELSIDELTKEHKERIKSHKSEIASLGEMDESIENLKLKAINLESEKLKIESRCEMLEENIKSMEERMEETSKSILDIKDTLKQYVDEGEKIKQEIKEKNKELDSSKIELNAIKEMISETEDKKSKLLKSLNDNLYEIKDTKSKLLMLQKMEEDMEGFSKGSKEILGNKNLKGIKDAVANIIKVKSGYEKAIEGVLSGQLQNIIVNTKEDTKNAIDFLKKNRLGRVTFLPLDSISGRTLNYNQSGTLAYNVVEYSSLYEEIVKYLLGRIVIVDTMDEAIALGKKNKDSFKIVTKDGEIFNVGGSVTGGSLYSSASIFTRRKTIEELIKKLSELESFKTKLEEELRRADENLDDLKRNLNDIDLKRENLEGFIVRKINENKELQIKEEFLKRQETSFEAEIQGIEKAVSDSKLTLKSDFDKIKSFEIEIKGLKNQINSKLNEKELIVSTMTSQDNKIRELEIEKTRQEETLNGKIKEKNELNLQLTNKENQIKNLEEETLFNEKEENRLKHYAEELKKESDDLKVKIKDLEAEKSNFEKERALHEEEIEKYHRESDELSKQLNSFSVDLGKKESDLSRYIYQESLIKEKIMEDYEMDIKEAQVLRDETQEISKKHIQSLKKSISELGNINMDAIEEFKNVKERYDFYLSQKTDLEDSTKKIENIIKDLEINMVKEFKESFLDINEKFKEVFKVLFGGGKGELILKDGEDILDSEIDINVQPPGKKLKSISVLSGGEKALSAIAILFSILMRKAVPFCILDEIDAPLDDANINRFISFLEVVSKETQFITITHRRGTMEASDYIYGITMQEKGVSKVLSLKLDEAESYIEN